MQMTSVFSKLGRNDARLIGRDSFLSGLLVYLIAVAVLMRFALPWLANVTADNPDITLDVPALYPLIIGYAVIFLGAVIAGVVLGFVLLDERDGQTLRALLVTPLPLRQYLAYRIFMPMLLSAVIIVAEVLIINQALIPLWQLILIAAAASTTAPLVMLFFATFAENKVQGFALNKILGTVGLTIIAAWFVEMPFQYLLGIFPPYWFVKAYWIAYAGGGEWPLYLLIGIVLMSAALAYLIRRFRRVAYQ